MLPNDSRAIIELYNLGFSQNQVRRLDRFLMEKCNKRLMQSREKMIREADKIAEPEGFTSIEYGVKPQLEKTK